MSRPDDLPAPAAAHRLPREWHQERARLLREKAGEKGAAGVLLQGRQNLLYFTGLWHSTTERPFAAFLPVDDDEDTIFWFHPYLDQELVQAWWRTESDHYFDFPHSEGGFPNRGEITTGDTVDLYAWMGSLLEERGYRGDVIGFDARGSHQHNPDFGGFEEALQPAGMESLADACVQMRIRKTPEEIALTQRAMDLWSEIHAFARDHILEHGTNLTDVEVAHAAQEWGTHRLMSQIGTSAEPHENVGIDFSISCRTGPVTAYPHPNQFYYKEIEPGDALQLAGVVRIGGYGGEQYRAFQIAPWDDWREKVWEVHTECYHIEAERSVAGTPAHEVAEAVHQHQIDNGVEELVYHRPGHGEGVEGHQDPYHALGDITVMEEGMMFSNEPGLYDVDNGFGYNHSNNILVTVDRGVQMGWAPVDKEWCFLEL